MVTGHCQIVQRNRAVFAGLLLFCAVFAIFRDISDLYSAKVNSAQTDAASDQEHQSVANLVLIIEILRDLQHICLIADRVNRAVCTMRCATLQRCFGFRCLLRDFLLLGLLFLEPQNRLRKFIVIESDKSRDTR